MKIHIRETQEQLLRKIIREEITTNPFSFDDLRSLKSLKARMTYCLSKLGKTIGRGSSRAVFNLGDGIVLKLAMNRKGLAQNRVEYENGQDYLCNIIPTVYNEQSDSEQYRWIVTDYAVPFKKESDFEKAIGMSWDKFDGFLVRMDYDRSGSWKREKMKWMSMMSSEEAWELADNIEIFNDIANYLGNYSHIPVNDMRQLQNWGYIPRDGENELVLLDSGFNKEVGKMYGFQMENIRIHKGNHGKTKSTQARWEDTIDCPHCGDGQKAFFSMSISDGGKGRGRIKVTDENGIEQDSEVQTIALYYCPKCYKFIAQNNMA